MKRKEMLLREGAHQLGLTVTDEQVERLLRYMELLAQWNTKQNLTAITTEEDIITKHFLDSLTCVVAGYIRNGGKAIDVGTGAGFPGIPIKIVRPGLDITLLDSLNKRIAFLKHVIGELGLKGAVPLHGRAEDVARDAEHREKYPLCFSRAVAHLGVVSEYCLPFVETGGFFLAMKGPGYSEEVKEAKKAIEILGGETVEIKAFNIPFTDITHYIIVIEKLRFTGSEYPRKAGKPAKKPLR
jgi:16S rRNA (guanine527-N7)-methyltransferase